MGALVQIAHGLCHGPRLLSYSHLREGRELAFVHAQTRGQVVHSHRGMARLSCGSSWVGPRHARSGGRLARLVTHGRPGTECVEFCRIRLRLRLGEDGGVRLVQATEGRAERLEGGARIGADLLIVVCAQGCGEAVVLRLLARVVVRALEARSAHEAGKGVHPLPAPRDGVLRHALRLGKPAEVHARGAAAVGLAARVLLEHVRCGLELRPGLVCRLRHIPSNGSLQLRLELVVGGCTAVSGGAHEVQVHVQIVHIFLVDVVLVLVLRVVLVLVIVLIHAFIVATGRVPV
mmetsp:Transcript_7451/g.20314  ORF Transcript_7451/g.20314 Transcript_7451/m.20314 type:complete len:290 (-) Transcript_7451:1500-2369(-)